MKYNEEKALEEILKFIENTYESHYVTDSEEDIQLMDIWISLGKEGAEATCRNFAIKYLMRYGKKDGKNRKDLLKAIHMIIFLMFFNEDLPEKVQERGRSFLNQLRTGTFNTDDILL